MGQSRTDLHSILLGVVDNVYFQPPTDIKLEYPCIIYRRDSDSSSFADNVRHRHKWRYEVTIIDRNPDSPAVDEMLHLPLCTFDRHFTTENLNHDVFHLFF